MFHGFLGLALFGLISIQAKAQGSCSNDRNHWQRLLNQWTEAGMARYTNAVATSTAAEPDQAALERSVSRLSAARAEIERCLSRLEQLGIAGCFRNLSNFAAGRPGHTPGHDFGFNMTDAEYLRTRRPEAVSIPEELRNGLPANYEELARQRGWQVARYRSGTVPNPPHNQHTRVVFYIPGDIADRYIQFTVADIENPNLSGEQIDVIGVEKQRRDAGGVLQTLPNPVISFLQYERRGASGHATVKRDQENCYRCHASGPRQIRPVPGSVPANHQAGLLAINNALDSYGEVSWDGAIQPNHHGPGLGERQTCTNCHDGFAIPGDTRGSLNSATDHQHIEQKMLIEFSMPPGLRANERFRAFFNARDKVENLTQAQRDELVRLQTPEGPQNGRSNRAMLDYLKKVGQLNHAEHRDAVAALNAMTQQQSQAFNNLRSDYRVTLRNWLRGFRSDCATARPPNPAPAATTR